MLKLTWLGHACFALEAEGYRILLDPYSPDYVPGLGRVELSAHKVLCSHDHADHGWKEGIPAPLNEIPCPFTIQTMPVFHDDQMGSLRGLNTIHVLEYNGIRVAHLGDLGHDLDDDQIEELGELDAVLLPIGGEVKDVLLLDVTPLSLGIETLGGVCTKLIERNTTIPTKKSQVFSTAADGQTSVEIHVLQGEREMAQYNKTLGRFNLTGIPAAPRGVPQIEVTFDIDANGIVHVSAKDLGTGNEQNITITASTNLSDEDIERAVKEAEQYAEEDKKRKEEIEIRNNADSLVYQTEKTVTELGDKIESADKQKIEDKVAELKKALEGTDSAAIKAATEALTNVSYEVFGKVYSQNAPQGEPGAAGAQQSSHKDDVVDADYEVVDEDK